MLRGSKWNGDYALLDKTNSDIRIRKMLIMATSRNDPYTGTDGVLKSRVDTIAPAYILDLSCFWVIG